MPIKEFLKKYGAGPVSISRAPGRVNLIGEHTDYNGGYVLPMAIDREVHIAFRGADDGRIEFASLDLGESVSVEVKNIDSARLPAWAKYPLGVVIILRKEGYKVGGFRAVAKSTVPFGAGLSSSAALEVATAMAVCAASELRISREEIARICREAENRVVGTRCGIMDQFASCLSRKGHALFLNCATHVYDWIRLPEEKTSIVVCNTCVKHELVGSPYNERRKQCAVAFKLLQRHFPEAETYRDLTVEMFLARAGDLDEIIQKRARHVVTENARVLAAVEALQKGRLVEFGILMDASHESLRGDFEVSCEELDIMTDVARSVPGVYGARMTGGGFGGCTVNLVPNEVVEDFQKQVASEYKQRTGIVPEIYVCSASDGATVEDEVKQ